MIYNSSAEQIPCSSRSVLVSPDFFLMVLVVTFYTKTQWILMIFIFLCLWVVEISEDRRRSNVTFSLRRSADPPLPAAILKITISASIYQPHSTARYFRFRTCLWNCDETINYFEVCCFPAATLNVCLESIASFSKHDVLFLDVVVEHAGVQRLIYLTAECWFLCSSYVWRGPEVEFLFQNFVFPWDQGCRVFIISALSLCR